MPDKKSKAKTKSQSGSSGTPKESQRKLRGAEKRTSDLGRATSKGHKQPRKMERRAAKKKRGK